MKEELKPLSDSAKSIKPGIYRHFKGNKYKVLSVGRNSETLEEVVVYQALYGHGHVWVRPVKSFVETVESAEPNGIAMPRFKYTNNNNFISKWLNFFTK